MSNYEQSQSRLKTIADRLATAVATYQKTMNTIKAQLGDQVFAPPDSGRYYSKAYENAEKRAWRKYKLAEKKAYEGEAENCQTVTRPNGQTVTTGYRIATVEEAVPGIEQMTDEVVAANAHLFAASPALLSAAKAALDLLNGLDECEMLLKFGDALHIIEQLDAAIAAADPDFVC